MPDDSPIGPSLIGPRSILHQSNLQPLKSEEISRITEKEPENSPQPPLYTDNDLAETAEKRAILTYKELREDNCQLEVLNGPLAQKNEQLESYSEHLVNELRHLRTGH